ncbi:MAG: hypothetical protein HOE98_07455 [Rhodospirillaceae bacterium]|nr:hypothetical protein [Rhodospirillaceae bacterium]MBT7837532.1 hypothetical protein [Rhodospirillaceae bacterium]
MNSQEYRAIANNLFQETYASLSRKNNAAQQSLACLEHDFSIIETPIGDDDDLFWNC